MVEHMKLVADSAPYSSDNRLSGFILLVVIATPLMVLPVYLLMAPPPALAGAAPAALAFAIGSLMVVLLFGLFLKTRGYLFKIPFRVYDEGVLIQPTAHIRPKVIEWLDLSSLELWVGIPYKKSDSGCAALTPAGEVKSTELFKSKDSLMEFISVIRPSIEEKGMKMVEENEGDSYFSVKFRRSLPF